MKTIFNTLICIYIIICSQFAFAELRDPTRPPVLSLANIQQVPITLTAIIISRNHRFAAINGALVKVGDQIGGDTVLSIEPNTVRLDGVDGNITLYLIPKSVKEAINYY